MSNVKTFGTVLKPFQNDAVNNGTAVLSTCLKELAKLSKESKKYAENKKLITSDIGAILFEAPTGTGKTLMAGHVAENISQLKNTKGLPPVIWFWFAPFSGLIDQAINTIKTEFITLRPKNPAVDRSISDLKSGDVFVTTWASVAVSNEASRTARKSTETMSSIDELVNYAKAQGFAIGVVIDEAHHTFRGQTKAFTFYKEVLEPELTILVTATPRDKDIATFTNATEITNLRRITISRQQAIEEHLIKEGVKAAVFKASNDVASFINFKQTALKQAVATHNRIKQALMETGQTVVPLLLVQVDSEEGSIEQTIAWLKQMGFRTEGDSKLIRHHTADEPDPFLSTIAADEAVEVLIFKMSVATGFDAPRAFTLVSFRPNRDEDFGVQVVGRILRVDRRLQVVKDLPYYLNYGYVFLSDSTSQTGLTSAAQRINQVKTELASVTTNVVISDIEIPTMQITQEGNETFLTYNWGEETIEQTDGSLSAVTEAPDNHETVTLKDNTSSSDSNCNSETENDIYQPDLFGEWFANDLHNNYGSNTVTTAKKLGYYYPLNTSLGSPRVFRRAILSLNNIDIVQHIVSRFRFDEDSLIVAQQSGTKIIKEEIEIFGNKKDRPEEIRADLAQKEIDARAQTTLLTADDFDVIDSRALYAALTKQFQKELEIRGIDHLFETDKEIRAGLHKILALRPRQLKQAISETVAQFTQSKDSEPLPDSIYSIEALEPARLNLYEVFPDDLNTWERPFAEYLDNDLTGTVLWWHRNPPRKPFSVTMPLPGQPDFYPDFIVGIKGRTHGNGILLIETKRVINDQERNALVKAQAKHPDYAKVMMVYWEHKEEWKVVEYDPVTDKNYLDRVLRTELLISY
ncbi:DEAD/DEAH box helicase family protein [Brevibacillus sp. RS1.1]|uniref:DEAD/DEAH box helicase n=1 Tax=Brevibacillus sp. RS1.1 TaxID=2738982 RepID=UPI00156ADDD4|nr:DEAD/DEAH box helicase family protein [Brevibacillus sp. RS1.1]NRR05511.1 DEAD/DEAH box helicase family protein [Brevibacillus sp. RS1.1]